MTRVKRGVTAHRRHREMVKSAKGFRGLRSRNFRAAKNAMMKSGLNAYVGRRLKKRTFRSLWIARINAACREHGVTYSHFIAGMAAKGIEIDRKMLAELAMNEPEIFAKIVAEVK